MACSGKGAWTAVAVLVCLCLGGVGPALAQDQAGEVAQAVLVAEWPLESPPGSVAVGPDGSVYVTINNSHKVVAYTPQGDRTGEWALEGPSDGLSVDSWGQVWTAINPETRLTMAESLSQPWIVGYTSGGEVLSQWPVDCPQCPDSQVQGLAAGPDGSIYVNINQNYRQTMNGGGFQAVFGYSSATGERTAQWDLEAPGSGITVGPDGMVHVNINQNYRVIAYTGAGELVAGWTYEGESSGLASDPSGNIYVTINNSHKTVGYTPAGAVFSEWTFQGRADSLATGDGRRFYLADAEASAIRVYELP